MGFSKEELFNDIPNVMDVLNISADTLKFLGSVETDQSVKQKKIQYLYSNKKRASIILFKLRDSIFEDLDLSYFSPDDLHVVRRYLVGGTSSSVSIWSLLVDMGGSLKNIIQKNSDIFFIVALSTSSSSLNQMYSQICGLFNLLVSRYHEKNPELFPLELAISQDFSSIKSLDEVDEYFLKLSSDN
jgi:hypothetical protein